MGTPSKLADFASLSLLPSLVQTTIDLGYTQMTPVQAASIPLLLQGRDVVAQSKTGSGKTVAFTLPLLQKMELTPRTLQALILCPTRELCSQVAGEIRKLGRRHAGLQVLVLCGGQPKYPQKVALEKGTHIVVGTPGRVLDHLESQNLNFDSVQTIVLDEADRMLDMGFQEDMEKILGALPLNRQISFFSATFPDSIKKMSDKYQCRPERITIKEADLETSVIDQVYYEVETENKIGTLFKALKHYNSASSIVFCNQKATVIEIAKVLQQKGLSSGSLHGDLEQQERDRVMAKFRNESIRILVATDVAARGIDVADLDAVYNFDLPSKGDIYVHRIGRTGRAGKTGIAISLIGTHEVWKLEGLEEKTGVKITKGNMADLNASKFDSKENRAATPAQMETLYISGGRKDKIRPGDILGALTGEAGQLQGTDIGKIEIHDHFSYVAVSSLVAKMAAKRLGEGKIKGRKFRVGLAQ